jgi:hypothetical protein
MYVCYMALEAATLATCYLLVDGETRNRLRKHWWIFTVLPAYRFFLFWNRLGGFLTVMNERPQWQVRAPWREAADHGGRLASKTAAITSELSASVLARPLSLLLGMFRTP